MLWLSTSGIPFQRERGKQDRRKRFCFTPYYDSLLKNSSYHYFFDLFEVWSVGVPVIFWWFFIRSPKARKETDSIQELILMFDPQVLLTFIPDPTNKAQIESMMLNLCGRIIDDVELYEDLNDATDKLPDVPYWTNMRQQVKVAIRRKTRAFFLLYFSPSNFLPLFRLRTPISREFGKRSTVEWFSVSLRWNT